MGFPRPEYWNGLPLHSPGDLPDAEIEPKSPALQANSGPPEPGKLSKSLSPKMFQLPTGKSVQNATPPSLHHLEMPQESRNLLSWLPSELRFRVGPNY